MPSSASVPKSLVLNGRVKLSKFSLLAEGSNAFVFKCSSSSDGQVVALKKMNCQDEDARRTAQAEVKVLSSVKHPNVVPLLEHELLGFEEDFEDAGEGGKKKKVSAPRN